MVQVVSVLYGQFWVFLLLSVPGVLFALRQYQCAFAQVYVNYVLHFVLYAFWTEPFRATAAPVCIREPVSWIPQRSRPAPVGTRCEEKSIELCGLPVPHGRPEKVCRYAECFNLIGGMGPLR